MVKKITKNVIFTKNYLKSPSLKCWNRKRWVTGDFGGRKQWSRPFGIALRSLTRGDLQAPFLSLEASGSWKKVLPANKRLRHRYCRRNRELPGIFNPSIFTSYVCNLQMQGFILQFFFFLTASKFASIYVESWEPLVFEQVSSIAQLYLFENSPVHQ